MLIKDKSHYFQPGNNMNPTGRPKVVAHVRELARKYTETAILTIADIMNDENSSASVRLAAANTLLDRAWGRPEQAIQVSNTDSKELEVEKLTTAELKRMLYESLKPYKPTEEITEGEIKT